ncbi:ABC1 kinase family protein [Rhizorhabdus sp. FW153]|uniref:ABC1 kinase family protein n=1 Tax=Rhizorhabdus sp. FW153 TaxID=3400216 RepID=UPI003CF594C5
MLQSLCVAARDRERLAEILGIASRFGLSVLLSRLGLDRAASEGGDPGDDALPRRTRLALEALGPTFIKLGQILATRSDLLPPDWIAELEALHSNAPTLPFERIRDIVEQALGEPPEEAFASFDVQPLAAASMAQVHRATTHDGRPVVLKIRRPGIDQRMRADLRLLAQLATIAEASSAEMRRYAPTELVRSLADAVLEELDFANEGRNAERLRADFRDDPRVVVPEIHWQWTSETLLVMDHVDGVPPSSAEALRSIGVEPQAIAELGADLVLDMVLINGRFHADPHPGNLLCLEGNRIALLDLGMLGHVSPRRREEFIDFVRSFATSDPEELASVLQHWSTGVVPAANIHRTANRLIARHGGQRIVLAAMVADFMALMRAEKLVLPADLLLIFKALMTIDGVLSGIVPDFDLSQAIERSTLRIAMHRLSPARWKTTLESVGRELLRAGDDAPRLIRAAVARLEAPAPSARADSSSALIGTLRWLAAAIFAGSALIAAAIGLR